MKPQFNTRRLMAKYNIEPRIPGSQRSIRDFNGKYQKFTPEEFWFWVKGLADIESNKESGKKWDSHPDVNKLSDYVSQDMSDVSEIERGIQKAVNDRLSQSGFYDVKEPKKKPAPKRRWESVNSKTSNINEMSLKEQTKIIVENFRKYRESILENFTK